MEALPKTCDTKAIEARWSREWIDRGLFHGRVEAPGAPYCIVIPPPNVTGILHMGHALNNTLQDVLVRWRRMQGRNAVWIPGTDHAGIATQNVVERALKAEGLTRDDLGREAFLERVWDWRAHYGGTITRQLRRLGASCDWDRERFTMDEGLSRAVREVFVRLYRKGLVYRGQYIINWCPRCGTALSDEESEHRPVRGKLYHIRYPVEGAGRTFVTVATTRPETLLGDVALAVNPRDERFQKLGRRTVRLPILDRPLAVIRDDFVDPAFGTGVVKVTPAHDPNDFEMARRHGLEPVDILTPDGRMNAAAGPYEGLDRFACRKRILADLEAQGLLEKVEDHAHAVGHCYRCDAVVEPRLSPQWFVKMAPLARPAIEAVRDGRIRFVPERWTKVYLEWMENIRDWCISRQIWWGHRIPVFTCEACAHEWAAVQPPAVCPECRAERVRQDEDVLDTWFSSWLWPFSVHGWPEQTPELACYYPTDTLVTAPEIIFFWVARMIMAGFEFMDDIPFSRVYIHGTVRAADGRKMSKSLGNAIDPLDVIEKTSADALRFSLLMLASTGQDVYLSDEKFELGRNFGTKVWNAARYLQQHGPPPAPEAAGDAPLDADEQHLLARLHDTIAACTDHLERFRFNDYALAVYEFIWHDYCDWFVEYSKDILYGDDAARRGRTLARMHGVFADALRLLHPAMPFLTEELWHAMGYGGAGESLVTAPWPEALDEAARQDALGIDPARVAYVEARRELVRAARTLRADYSLPPARAAEFIVRPGAESAAEALRADTDSIVKAIRASRLRIEPDFTPPQPMPCAVTRLGTVYMSVEGLIDVDAERRKLRGALEKAAADLDRTARKLQNEDFLRKAPAAVVARAEQRKAALEQQQARLQRLLEALGEEASS